MSFWHLQPKNVLMSQWASYININMDTRNQKVAIFSLEKGVRVPKT